MIFSNFHSALKETCWFVLWIYSSWNSSRAPLALSCQTIGQQKGYGRCVWNIILSTGNFEKTAWDSCEQLWVPSRSEAVAVDRVTDTATPYGSVGSPFVCLFLSPGRAPHGLELIFCHGPKLQLPFLLPSRLGCSSAVTHLRFHLIVLTSSLCFHFFPKETSSAPAPLLVCQECSSPLSPGHCCTSASSLLALG